MQIIGNGMIAKSFKNFNLANTCIFASGVADSTETDLLLYKKEFELLKKTINQFPQFKFIYFSTLSIFKFEYNEYVKHKLFIENYIENNLDNYLILRLPNIVGQTVNSKQLLPFLFQKISSNSEINVKNNTYRDLIDVEDLPKIVKFLIEKNIVGKINISLNNKITVTDIIDTLKDINGISTTKINKININDTIYYTNDLLNYDFDFTQKSLNTDPINIIKKYYTICE
jgi:nucleoside-diphosphate-sugar epimerase